MSFDGAERMHNCMATCTKRSASPFDGTRLKTLTLHRTGASGRGPGFISTLRSRPWAVETAGSNATAPASHAPITKDFCIEFRSFDRYLTGRLLFQVLPDA